MTGDDRELRLTSMGEAKRLIMGHKERARRLKEALEELADEHDRLRAALGVREEENGCLRAENERLRGALASWKADSDHIEAAFKRAGALADRIDNGRRELIQMAAGLKPGSGKVDA